LSPPDRNVLYNRPPWKKEPRMGGHLEMSAKERRRKVELKVIGEGLLTIKEEAANLGLSYQQCRRYGISKPL
jgi:hypothetical protein